MSSGTENRTKVAFLPIEFDLPSTQNSALFTQIMNERERDTATVLNQKENAVYAREETVTSQRWFFEANIQQDGFRRLYLIPMLVEGTTTTIPHELGDITGFTFTNYKSFVQLPDGTSFRPLAAEVIEITADNVEITLPMGSIYDGYEGQIVLEFLKT